MMRKAILVITIVLLAAGCRQAKEICYREVPKVVVLRDTLWRAVATKDSVSRWERHMMCGDTLVLEREVFRLREVHDTLQVVRADTVEVRTIEVRERTVKSPVAWWRWVAEAMGLLLIVALVILLLRR